MSPLTATRTNTLFLTVGPPGSGKTRFLLNRFPRHQIFSLDFFRARIADNRADQGATKEAVEILHAIVTGRMRRRLTTYVDATNVEHMNVIALMNAVHRAEAEDAYAFGTRAPMMVPIMFHAEAQLCVDRQEPRKQYRSDTIPHL